MIGFMDSPADAKATIAGIFDRSAPTYEQAGPAFFAPIGAELAGRAEPAPGERLLDVGCGRGHVLLPAAEAITPGGTATGIDLAPAMVAATAAEAERRGLRHVTVRLGDAAAPAFPAGSFDVVTAGLVIFFLPDPGAALRAWAELLGPGGRLAFSTFSTEDSRFGEVIKTLAGFLDGEPPRRAASAETFRSTDNIHDLVTANGFTEVRSETVVLETRFTDPDQWWRWLWSHGARVVVERLPAERLDAARAAAYEIMREARTPEGDLAIRSGVRYTTAVVCPQSMDGG